MELGNINEFKAAISEARHSYYSLSIGEKFNQDSIGWLYSEAGEKLVSDVKSDIQQGIISLIDEDKKLSQFVRLVYYETLQYYLILFKSLGKKLPYNEKDKISIRLHNGYIHDLSELSIFFRTEMKLSTGATLNEAKTNDFNITGNYFKSIVLLPPGSIIAPRVKAPRPKKPFIDYLSNIETDKKQIFADKLKAEFPGFGGKELAVMLKALESNGYIAIIPRQQKAIYDSLRLFFGWDICDNEAINKGLRKIGLYQDELTHYSQIIQSISKSIR